MKRGTEAAKSCIRIMKVFRTAFIIIGLTAINFEEPNSFIALGEAALVQLLIDIANVLFKLWFTYIYTYK